MNLKKIVGVLRPPKSKPKNNIPQADLGLLPPTPLWSRVMIWTIGAGSVSLIIWSVFTKVEETVMLQGEIATAKPAVPVKALDPGVIESILIAPHQPITTEQPLIIYGDDETKLRLKSLKKRLQLIKIQNVSEVNMYNFRIEQSKQQLALDRDMLRRLTFLLKEGAIQETQVIEKKTQISKAELSIESIREEKQRSIHQTEQASEELKGSIQELEAKSNRFTITSPVNGFIQDVKYQSPGTRIQQGDVVATIIPDRELIAKVKIPSKLSAPIEVKSLANLDVDAFPASEFGSIEAEVISLSPMTSAPSGDSPQKLYNADLKLLKPSAPDLFSLDQLRPGMAITARIRLREKPAISTVFEFLSNLFDPLTEQR